MGRRNSRRVNNFQAFSKTSPGTTFLRFFPDFSQKVMILEPFWISRIPKMEPWRRHFRTKNLKKRITPNAPERSRADLSATWRRKGSKEPFLPTSMPFLSDFDRILDDFGRIFHDFRRICTSILRFFCLYRFFVCFEQLQTTNPRTNSKTNPQTITQQFYKPLF